MEVITKLPKTVTTELFTGGEVPTLSIKLDDSEPYLIRGPLSTLTRQKEVIDANKNFFNYVRLSKVEDRWFIDAGLLNRELKMLAHLWSEEG